MTVLKLIRDFTSLRNLSKPTSIKSLDPNTQKSLAILVDKINELTLEHAWPELEREYVITLQSGVETYALPDDFRRIIPNTFHDRSTTWRVNAPISTQDYQQQKSRNWFPELINKRVRIFGDTSKKIHIQSVPNDLTNGHILAFNYVSCEAIRPQDFVGQMSLSNGDTIYHDGNKYKCVSSGTCSDTAPTHTNGQAVNGTATLEYYKKVQKEFERDSDIVVLDNTLVLRALEAEFFQTQEAIFRYERYKELVKSKMNSAPVFKMGDDYLTDDGIFYGE